MVTETPDGMTLEEAWASLEARPAEETRIADAIVLGINEWERRSERQLSAKRRKKVESLVESALDALPYASGCQPLTDADVEFAKRFAATLAGNFGSR